MRRKADVEVGDEVGVGGGRGFEVGEVRVRGV